MFWVYILKSDKDGGIYIGKTNNIERRLREHNSGSVQSTKSRKPLTIIHKFECETEMEALKLEKEMKKGYKREGIKKQFGLK